MAIDAQAPVAALLQLQRTHMLLVLSHPSEEREVDHVAWFTGPFRESVSAMPGVVAARCYRQHEVDITKGRYAPVEYGFLAIVDLSLDGGDQAEPILCEIADLHRQSGVANPPATWLYFPSSEKAGRQDSGAGMITVAYANPVPGTEAQFREFYVTRHLRHALKISALVGGQCFERAQHQRAGSMQPYFQMVAIYDQIAEPDAFLESYALLPPGSLDFPMLDKTRGRFSECSYQLLG